MFDTLSLVTAKLTSFNARVACDYLTGGQALFIIAASIMFSYMSFTTL
jgi:hypothetical protein